MGVIHEGEPDRVSLWLNGGATCDETLASVLEELHDPTRPPDPDNDPCMVEVVEDGDDIDTD